MSEITNSGTNTGPNLCERLKERLVEEGELAPERHPQLAAHAADCAACQRLLAAWDALPGLLGELPEHEPDEVLLQKVRAAVAAEPAVRKPARRRYLAPSLASAAILLAAVGISRELLLREAPRLPAPIELRSTDGQPPRVPMVAPEALLVDEPGRAGQEKAEGRPEAERLEGAEETAEFRAGEIAQSGFGDRSDDDRPRLPGEPAPGEAAREAPAESAARRQIVGAAEQKRDRALAKVAADSRPVAQSAEEADAETLFEVQSGAAGLKDADTETRTDQNEQAGRYQDAAAPAAAGPAAAPESPAVTEAHRAEPAFDFFAHYGRTEGLSFQPATGYWANTHVPGDPVFRLLSARLAQWDRSWLADGAELERAVRPIPQPFDAPDGNALALSLMTDAAGIPADGEPARLRLQVGIQGVEHRRGQRPAMNVAAVVDLPPDAPDGARIAARALLDALLEAKQAGDRFALVLTGTEAGHPGLVIGADEFRHGPLQLARDRILGRAEREAGLTAAPDQAYLDAHAALQRAGALVRAAEEPGRPLGSSTILLISARAFDDLERLTALTHRHAGDGITTSVFPLGNGPTGAQAERLVLAGLGHRRILAAPAEARRLIEDELHASSRAVARAARLAIRLAPGVRLIGVIGSKRLDEPEAQRVRAIENALDRRLAADTGIQADRGEDEEGIQIVIPAIHSGDSVTVLLDLVADRPGAIADVTLRYKDLVYLRNGSLAAQLQLPRVERAMVAERGPAERAVLKNLLAHHFAEAVEEAADALGRGDAARAADILRGMRATMEQARRDLPAWSDDADLTRDEQVLERYIAALESPQAANQGSYLADSLRLAAFAKTHSLPKEWK